MAIGPDDVLTPAEAAELLKIPPKTIVQMCREGRIPTATKIGRQWRMLRSGLKELFTAEAVAAEKSPCRAAEPRTTRPKRPAQKPSRAEILQRLRGSPRT